MSRAIRILFLSDRDLARSQMAAGLMRAGVERVDRVDRAERVDRAAASAEETSERSSAVRSIEVESAGVNARLTESGIDPLAVQVMAEVGIDLSGPGQRVKGIGDLGTGGFDVIITLSAESRAYCEPLRASRARTNRSLGRSERSSLLVGAPVYLHWDAAEPMNAAKDAEHAENAENADETARRDALRRVRETLSAQVDSLRGDGYLEAIAAQREQMDRLADVLDDGIIAHDADRNIFLFNRAAEAITGRPRAQVLGADCHRAFPPHGLCGAQCRFRHGPTGTDHRQEYRVAYDATGGESKRLKMTAEPIRSGVGSAGVLAVIRDVTEVGELRRQLDRGRDFHGMVGRSIAVREVFETIQQVASSVYPVLVTGESGTGKELVAHAIHKESRRRDGPFVPINCGALPENILESELYGHVRGAFTGAIRDKKGRFELADRGTLFLDEVGELSPPFQVKLLRVLQEKRFEMVGGEKPITVDVRIVAATNRDLRQMIRAGTFREDLFYRLCVVPVVLPPLRERAEDIPILADHVLAGVREETGSEIRRISPTAMQRLVAHRWPGNVRELINALQLASVRCSGDEIGPEHLPPEIAHPSGHAPRPVLIRQPDPTRPLMPPLDEPGLARPASRLSWETVNAALDETGGNKVQAAKRLGVGRATLYRFLKSQKAAVEPS